MVKRSILELLMGGGGACKPVISSLFGNLVKFFHHPLSEESNKNNKILRSAQNDNNNEKDFPISHIKKSPLTLITPHKDTHHRSRKIAFTLAEVLITLGVIGVVAAITMPVLTKHYQHKVLESQFKKTYAEISQITSKLAYEFGNCPANFQDSEIKSFIWNSYKSPSNYNNHTNYSNSLRTYNLQNKDISIHLNCFWNGSMSAKRKILQNGAYLATCSHAHYGTLLTFDTNGPYKGPNSYGHDVFFLKLESNCRLNAVTRSPRQCTTEEIDTGKCNTNSGSWISDDGVCSKNSNSSVNGLSCFEYALRNKCPNDSTKTYWECLP